MDPSHFGSGQPSAPTLNQSDSANPNNDQNLSFGNATLFGSSQPTTGGLFSSSSQSAVFRFPGSQRIVQDQKEIHYLDWSLRNRIINIFINFSEQLHGLKVAKDVKEKLSNENREISGKLICLKESKSKPTIIEQTASPSKSDLHSDCYKLVVEVSEQTRLRIIENLSRNHFAVAFEGSNEENGKIIQENKYLTQILLNLNTKIAIKTLSDLNEEALDSVVARDNEKMKSDVRLKEIIKEQILNVFKEKDNSAVFLEFVRGFMDKVCTFTFTGRNYIDQVAYYCYTCNLTDNLGVCKACVDTCHKGHKTWTKPNGQNNFCDCGAENPRCKTILQLPKSA